MRYYILICVIYLVFFGNFIIRGKTPFNDCGTNDWYGDTYHTNTLLYKKAESFFHGRGKWDFTNSFGIMNEGYLGFPNLNIIGLFHYILVAKLGSPLFETTGWIIFILFLFCIITFFYFLHDCLRYSNFLSVIGSLLLLSNMAYFYPMGCINYTVLLVFFPLALICIYNFIQNANQKNTVFLAMIIAFPAFTGMFVVYINYVILIYFTLIISLVPIYCQSKMKSKYIKGTSKNYQIAC